MKVFDLFNTYMLGPVWCKVRGKDHHELSRVYKDWHELPKGLLRTKVFSWVPLEDYTILVEVEDETLKIYLPENEVS